MNDQPSIAVTPDDLLAAASVSRRMLEPFADRDWAASAAGDLAWDVRTTVAHVCDAVGWYAAHLAVASPRRLRVDFRAHCEATNAELLEVLDAAAATLAQVARAAPAGVRAYHSAGMADTCGFLAMGCNEILIHCWDSARGLRVDFEAPAQLAARVLRRLFPWAPHAVAVWPTLLWATGRADLPGHQRRPGPDWEWHCAPLHEWDGTIPHRNNPPHSQFRWDATTHQWHPSAPSDSCPSCASCRLG